jgi:uncharacterized protein YggE
MKARALILTTLAFLAANAALAQRDSDIPSISTSGSATVKVVPDQIEISLSVESEDALLAKAKAANDAAVARVLTAARKRIADPARIQTDFMQVSTADRIGHPAAYVVRKSIVIESNDIPGFEALVADLLGAGANRLHSIRFMTSALRTHRDEARRLAIKAALEKAQLLAGALGKKVGMARHISEATDHWTSYYGSWMRGGGAGSNTVAFANDGGESGAESTLAPGRISVTASINVVFDLE